MMGERPENDTTHEADWLSEDGLDEREPLLFALTEDGARWRAENVTVVEKVERRLEATLLAWSDEPPKSRATIHVEPGRSAVNSDHAQPRLVSVQDRRRGLRVIAVLVGVIVVLALVIGIGTIVALRAADHLQVQTIPHFPPQKYVLTDRSAFQAATAQEAFGGLTLTPCMSDPGATATHGAPPRTATSVWLFSNQDYGIVRIYVTCARQPRPYSVFLLEFEKEEGYWIITRDDVVDNTNLADSPIASSSAHSSSVPPWLTLPADSYVEASFHGSYRDPQRKASVITWYSPTRIYAFGHIAFQITRPDDSTTVQIDGHTGWATQVNGYVTVTVPLADGTTAFFSGNGSLKYVESLATSAIAHMNTELLPLGAP